MKIKITLKAQIVFKKIQQNRFQACGNTELFRQK